MIVSGFYRNMRRSLLLNGECLVRRGDRRLGDESPNDPAIGIGEPIPKELPLLLDISERVE